MSPVSYLFLHRSMLFAASSRQGSTKKVYLKDALYHLRSLH